MRTFLEEKRFAVLATINPTGAPQLTVMWYLLDGDEFIAGVARESGDGAAGQRDIHRLAVRYQGEASAAKAMERFGREERVSYRIAISAVYAAGF